MFQHRERQRIRLLGDDKRPEKIVLWSQKHPAGTRWTKDFPYGLRLGFVADGDAPRMYIHWNQAKFEAFLKGLGFEPDTLFFADYGVCVRYSGDRLRVTLPGLGATQAVLWDTQRDFCKQQAGVDVYWVTGKLTFGAPPVFYTRLETQQELEEATAVASIRVTQKPTPAKTPAKVLAKPPVAEKTGSYLLQDAIVSTILAAAQQQRAK